MTTHTLRLEKKESANSSRDLAHFWIDPTAFRRPCDVWRVYAGVAWHASLQGFAGTEFSKVFWGKQSRLGVKFLQHCKAISISLNMGKESVPATLEKLHALTPPSAPGNFIGSHSKTSDNRSLNLVTIPQNTWLTKSCRLDIVHVLLYTVILSSEKWISPNFMCKPRWITSKTIQ